MGFITINNTNTSTWTTHRVTMEELLKNGLDTPLMTVEEWRAMFDPCRQEVTVHCKSEMKHYAHARLGQCPNCGANDWMPFFRIGGNRGYDATLDHYTCVYCGTRKEV